MRKKEIIKHAKKEYNSSDDWLYQLFTHKEDEDYMFIRQHGSTYFLGKEDICVSSNGKHGIICCFGLWFYDLNLRKTIWKIKHFITERNNVISIDSQKSEICILCTNKTLKKRVKVVIGFDGKIKQHKKTFDLLFSKEDLGVNFELTPKIIYYNEKQMGNTRLYKRERYKLEGAPKVNDLNLFIESFAIEHFKKKGYNVSYYERDVGTDLCNESFSKSYSDLVEYLKFYSEREDITFLKMLNLLKLLVKFVGRKNIETFLKINRLCGKPDLLVYNNAECFFVEIKSYKDKLRENQRTFISASILNGMPKVELLYVYPSSLSKRKIETVRWTLKQILKDDKKRIGWENDTLHPEHTKFKQFTCKAHKLNTF